MRFADYHISDEIKKSIAKLGYNRPTDIQFKTIPHVLKGEDVLAIAQTGTGKTAAFAIPIIERLHLINKTKRSKEAIRALVMVPTRELALQIGEVFTALCRNTRVRSFALIGGVEQEQQIQRLEGKLDILISTPGRLFDLVSQGHLHLGKISILVLDEADHMLDLGFIKDIRDLMRHLPQRRQTLFFSATIDKEIKKLAYSLVHKPIRIQISPKDPVSKNVEHAVLFVEMDDKRFFLEHLIKQYPKSKFLVFTRTKVRAERVVKAMERLQIQALSMHGDKNQQERGKAMRTFAQGDVNVLIATDVSARGIDIPHVDFVINYDLPEQAEEINDATPFTALEKTLIVLFGIAIGSYVIAEIQTGAWLINYIVKVYSFSENNASTYMSLFFLVLSLGRLFGGFIAHRVGYLKTVTISLFIAIAMYLGGLLAGQAGLSIIAFSGLFFAVCFPTIVLSLKLYFPKKLNRAMGIIMTISVGINVLSNYPMGFLSDNLGVYPAMFVIPFALFISSAILIYIQYRFKISQSH